MKKTEIEQKRDLLGSWTAHKIKFVSDEGEIVYTKPGEGNGNRELMNRLSQVVVDIYGDIKNLSFIDLACLEGLHGMNFAAMGAKKVAFLEPRKTSMDRTKFAIDVLKLNNCVCFQDDMRNLSKEVHGLYDIVICFGVIYHFRVPEVFDIIKKVKDIANKAVIFDAVFIPDDKITKSYNYDGNEYFGHIWDEDFQKEGLWGPYDASLKEREIMKSWKFSFPSFIKYLTNIGFGSVYDICSPIIENRRTVLAIKGNRVRESLPMI